MSDSAKNALLDAIIKPLPDPRYTVDVQFGGLERALENYQRDWGLNLYPDFQRGHVWTEQQQVAYLEGVFRGTVGASQRIIQFNAPHWETDDHGGDLPNELQIMDGLQRLTAVRRFMASDLAIFTGLRVDDLEGSRYSARRGLYRLQFCVHNFTSRADLIMWYVDFNSSGTPHSADEIARVKGLLATATSTQEQTS